MRSDSLPMTVDRRSYVVRRFKSSGDMVTELVRFGGKPGGQTALRKYGTMRRYDNFNRKTTFRRNEKRRLLEQIASETHELREQSQPLFELEPATAEELRQLPRSYDPRKEKRIRAWHSR